MRTYWFARAFRTTNPAFYLDFEHAIQRYARPAFYAGTHLDAIHYAPLDEVLKGPGKMLRADAVHRGAQAAGRVESDDLFALRSKPPRQPVDEMNLSADGKG